MPRFTLIFPSLTLVLGAAVWKDVAAQSGALSCYQRARSDTTLGEALSLELCMQAASPEPVDCFLEARRTTVLSEGHVLDLCRPKYRQERIVDAVTVSVSPEPQPGARSKRR